LLPPIGVVSASLDENLQRTTGRRYSTVRAVAVRHAASGQSRYREGREECSP